MAITYTVLNTTAATMRCGYRDTLPTAFDSNRIFFRFDLTGSGILVASIVSVTFKFVVQSVVGSANTYRLRSDKGVDNWGTALDATAADYESTDTALEADQSIGTTGAKQYTVNKNNLDLNGMNWFRMAHVGTVGTQDYIQVYTQNYSVVADRPKLVLNVRSQQSALSIILMIPVLYFASDKTYYGDATDGQIRATDTAEPDPEA